MNVRKHLWIVIGWIMLIFMGGVNVLAQSEAAYDITKAQIKADVTAEGVMTFTDVYTYKVDSINGIYFDIDFKGASLLDYQVGIINPDTGQIEYFEEASSHLPGTFVGNIEDELLKLKVFYPVSNETVDFVFKYRMNGLVTNYLDTAEINREIVGKNINENLDVTADIVLPGSVDNKEDLRAWLFGDPQGNIALNQQGRNSTIHIEVSNNSANQFVEVNALFPTSLTPNNRRVIEKKQKDALIERNDNQVKQDKRAYQLSKTFDWSKAMLGILLGPLVTLGLIYYYFKERKRLNPNPKHVPDHVYELPEEIAPAIMAAAYLDRPINADDFSATILDLVRRKYIELTEVELERRSGMFHRGSDRTITVRKLKDFGPNSELQQHEVYVMHYLFGENRTQVSLSDIELEIQKKGYYAKEQNRWWTRFNNFAFVMGQQHMAESSQSRMNCRQWSIFSALIAFLVVPSIFAFIVPDSLINEHSGFIMIAVGLNMLLNIIMALIIKIKPIISEKEDYHRKSWKSFARMLDDVGQMDMREVGSLQLWDKFLVYAVSLGVADKVIESMSQTYGMQEMEEQLSLPRAFYHNPYLINHALRGSLNSSIVSAQPKVTQTVGQYRGNNMGGFGGGASSGSSGGSGGRGGTGGF